MNPLLETGEMVITIAEDDYFLRPSFIAMTRIGSPDEIVDTYTLLNGSEFNEVVSSVAWRYASVPVAVAEYLAGGVASRIRNAAIGVIEACCDVDASALTGEWVSAGAHKDGGEKLVYSPGRLPVNDMVIIAQELMSHGIMGKAPVRKLQRHEGRDEFVREFRAVDYINAARSHFGMSRDEAEQLTMTEFQLMLKAKYPEEKGFTREEYDDIMSDFERKKRQRIEAEMARKRGM